MKMGETKIDSKILLGCGVVIAAVLLVGYTPYVLAAWQEPQSAPPTYEVPVPINVGDQYQKKAGSLSLGRGFVSEDIGGSGLAARLVGPVGIGANPPTEIGVSLEVANRAAADDFCFRYPTNYPDDPYHAGTNTGKCLSATVGSGGVSGSGLQKLLPGPGIVFKNNATIPAKIDFIGANGTTINPTGRINRDFTVKACSPSTANAFYFLNTIDQNEVQTPTNLNATKCVNVTTVPSGGLTKIVSHPGDSSIIVNPQTGGVNLRVNGAVIQGTVISTKCKDLGQVIGKIYPTNNITGKFQNVDVDCTPAGYSTTNFCTISGRNFSCSGVSVAIP